MLCCSGCAACKKTVVAGCRCCRLCFRPKASGTEPLNKASRPRHRNFPWTAQHAMVGVPRRATGVSFQLAIIRHQFFNFTRSDIATCARMKRSFINLSGAPNLSCPDLTFRLRGVAQPEHHSQQGSAVASDKVVCCFVFFGGFTLGGGKGKRTPL